MVPLVVLDGTGWHTLKEGLLDILIPQVDTEKSVLARVGPCRESADGGRCGLLQYLGTPRRLFVKAVVGTVCM